MPIKSVMPSSHLILCRPLLLLPPIPPSIRVFSSESTLRMRWPKDWSFSFSISPSNEHPGLISFRMDWLDLLAVQGTLKSLLQNHSSKASIFRCSAFFTVQLYHRTPQKGSSCFGARHWPQVLSQLRFTLKLFQIFLPSCSPFPGVTTTLWFEDSLDILLPHLYPHRCFLVSVPPSPMFSSALRGSVTQSNHFIRQIENHFLRAFPDLWCSTSEQ